MQAMVLLNIIQGRRGMQASEKTKSKEECDEIKYERPSGRHVSPNEG